MVKKLLLAAGLAFSTSLMADQQPDLVPDPLTLDYVLSLPATMDPEFVRQQAMQMQSEANQKLVDAEDGIELNLLGRLGKREFKDENQNFNFAAIHLGVPLFDFGRTSNNRQAWWLQAQSEETQKQLIQRQFKIKLTQAYFNVLLADLQYRVDNEAMAVAYVEVDDLREKYELNRVSDTELYEYELRYQKAFLKRQKSQAKLRHSRMQLANLMGRNDITINEVAMPEMPDLPAKLLDLDDYLALALDNNKQLAAARQSLDAAGYKVKQARSSNKPTIRADVLVGHLSDYPKEREGRWEAGISLKMPLYDSGVSKSKVDLEQAKRQQAQADLMSFEQQVREQVMNLYFDLSTLNTEAEGVKTLQTFAEYNFDYRSALYENEMAAVLGDAMVMISQSDFEALAFDLKKVLLWRQMELATGIDDLTSYQMQAGN